MRRGASPTTIPHDVDERVAIVHPMSPITPTGIQEMPQEEFVFHSVEAQQQQQPDAMVVHPRHEAIAAAAAFTPPRRMDFHAGTMSPARTEEIWAEERARRLSDIRQRVQRLNSEVGLEQRGY